MSNFKDQIEEIRRIISSSTTTKSQKPYAYSTLLRLQELAATDSALVQVLADSADSFVSLILIDISENDEEIAAQALKCLGFMIYHPSIVVTISGDNASLIIDSLVRVITTTRIKSVCSLGVWCISIQQFKTAILGAHFQALLRAIAHALDNPIGSLSITFEAMQATMKLATLLGEKMRDLSNVWAPPIYRRLVSLDKREREISERCLLKIKSIICPAPLVLSKAIFFDLKKKLLSAIHDLLKHGMKIQAMQAWGWFICFLGPFAMKYKHLLNEMLKFPELTFSDLDPQVQIASLVAWESLIDVLILPPTQASDKIAVSKRGTEHFEISEVNDNQTEADKFPKGIKLIMTPLIGIMSSKCDISVHVACLNTWSYLLHKLDIYIGCHTVIKSVWEPIFKAVFEVGPNNKTAWSWNLCLDQLDAFAASRSMGANHGVNNQKIGKISDESSVVGLPESINSSWRNYPIKWSPWHLSELEFFTKMINIVLTRGLNAAVSLEFRILAQNTALRSFRSLLRAVQTVLKDPSTTYDEVMLCLTVVLRLLKEFCENATSEDGSNVDLCHASLELLQIVTEEVESSILESPLYKLALDLKCLEKLEPVGKFRSSIASDIRFLSYMEMVSPAVYLIVLYFSVATKLASTAAEFNSVSERMCSYVQLLISSYNAFEIFFFFAGLLYKYGVLTCSGIWKILANCIRDYLDAGGKSNLLLFNKETNKCDCSAAVHFLAYPFALCSHPQIQEELQDILEQWTVLYTSVTHALQLQDSPEKSFTEDLCSLLSGQLEDTSITVDSEMEIHQGEKNQITAIILLSGNAVSCVLEQLISRVSLKGSKMNHADKCTSNNVKSSLGLAARFMNLASARKETIAPTCYIIISRIFSQLIHYVDNLCFKEDIVTLIEIMRDMLLKWLSLVEVHNEEIKHQLQLFWSKILNSFRRSHPPIKFDSTYLEFHASLLEKTLDHQNIGISEPTIRFWNSTYGELEQLQLEYPQSLLPLLDKLSRNRKINISKRSSEIHVRDCFGRNTTAPQRCMVSATLTGCSKRVELMKDAKKDSLVNLGSKRKRPELTEHQKEVRRAQQGRSRDSSGHGPGIRTYTSVDFSQGNEESQEESQDIRDADSILEMLRRVC